MPLYQYRCSECEYEFEIFARMDDYRKECEYPCPECGKMSVERVLNTHFEMMAPDQLGRVKPTASWREHLRNLKKKNPGSSDFKTWEN
jgi:putative FmdB family regulatory protein